ncbi:MAG TPA: hypothetical protein VF472_19730 [Burkholderiaceae bacterium]
MQNATAEDTAQLNHALEYLQQSPDAQEILKGMHDKGVKISIIHDGNDHYTDGNKTIYWDPKSALTVQPNAGGKSTGMQSPALGLIHEGAHATDPDLVKHASEANAQYENNAEKYAIDKENKIGATLGEPKRENHLAAALPNVADSTTHSVNVYDKDGKLLKTEEHTYSSHKRKRDSEEPHADEAPAKDPKLAAAGEKFESLMNSLKEFKETGKTASMDATMKNIGDANVTGLIPDAAVAVTRKEQQTQLETARQAPQPAPAIGQPKGPSR